MNDKSYWEQYYKKNPNPVEPSTFARFTSGFLHPGNSLIELGCGNGRDSVFFAQNNLNVTAIDQVESEMDYLNHKYSLYNLDFKADDFTRLTSDKSYDYVYSRFTLHSINEEAEARVLKWIGSNLKDQGYFFLEVRSINDPMFQKGEKISDNENVTTHYRRYLNLEDTINKIEKCGLKIIYQLETNSKVQKVKDKTTEKREYPIAVLINAASASASEILASAIKESYHGLVVGTNSYGKGTVQKTKKLSDGSMIKYTTEKWLTPNGTWINEVGVIPTDFIELKTVHDMQNNEPTTDKQFEKAKELILEKIK